MIEQVKGLLGFAMRAGQAHVGAQKTLDLIQRGKAALVLVDETAARNTLDRLARKCQEGEVPLRVLPQGLLGQAIGRPQTMAMALQKGHFAAKLAETLPETNVTDRQTDNQ